MKQTKVVQMMIWELDRSYQLLLGTLIEISKEEAQWKPSPHARTLETIRQWNMKGNEWFSAQKLDPISTIEFKVIHLAECKEMYDEYAFRDRTLTWSELESPEWPICRDYLRETQAKLVKSLHTLSDDQLEELVPTNWGEHVPTKQIIAIMIHHDAYHFGQICTIRNLYRTNKCRKTGLKQSH